MAHGALDLGECREAAPCVEEFVLDHEPTDQQVGEQEEHWVADEPCEGLVDGKALAGRIDSAADGQQEPEAARQQGV